MTPADMKTCCQCGDAKPRTPEFFHRMRSGSDGLQNRCKVCSNGVHTNVAVYRRIARALGVTPSQVRRIEHRALRKLRRRAMGEVGG